MYQLKLLINNNLCGQIRTFLDDELGIQFKYTVSQVFRDGTWLLYIYPRMDMDTEVATEYYRSDIEQLHQITTRKIV